MPLVYGHRGASAAERENTLAAFDTARRMGADGVELDVRRTADGALVVAHDPLLADGRALVSLDRAELPSDVLELHEALDACTGIVVNVEIKNLRADPDFDPGQSVATGVVELLAARRSRAAGGGRASRPDRVLVSSFNLDTVDHVRALDPAIATGVLVTMVEDTEVDAVVERTRAAGHGALHPYDAFVTPRLVETCAVASLAVNAWTVNDPARIVELADMGVAGIVTDVPDVALA
ncbi:MAG: glycerophosphodiester phosphodiesterase, partial [Acidimicrobiia bacterium]|nr:glycerophosphodiester phosphodiesterase [Acidimicrobiia bacterium]